MLTRIKAWLNRQVIDEAVNYLKHQTNDQLQKQDWVGALESLKKIFKYVPNDVDVLVTLLRLRLKLQQVEEGLPLLVPAIRLNEANSGLVIEYVTALESLWSWENLEQLTQDILQEFPENVDLRLYLAQRLVDNARIDEALKQLNLILTSHPNHLEAMIGLTYCFISKGHKQQALGLVERIQIVDPKRSAELMNAIYENVQNFE